MDGGMVAEFQRMGLEYPPPPYPPPLVPPSNRPPPFPYIHPGLGVYIYIYIHTHIFQQIRSSLFVCLFVDRHAHPGVVVATPSHQRHHTIT
jgi:hypothetical protein